MVDGSVNGGESTRGICMEHLLRNDPKFTHTTEARQARTNLPGALKKAAGILGNGMAETNLEPTRASNSTYWGLFQWSYGRKDALFEKFKEAGQLSGAWSYHDY